MSAIYLPMLALVAGILGLLWGADRFVAGQCGRSAQLWHFTYDYWPDCGLCGVPLRQRLLSPSMPP